MCKTMHLETIKLINHSLNGSLSTHVVDSTPIKSLTAIRSSVLSLDIIPPPLDLATKEPKVANNYSASNNIDRPSKYKEIVLLKHQ